jgi:peptide methionine sulfoxide reductase MsrB
MHSDRAGKLTRSDEEWKKALTLEQYRVTRQHGTERAFSNPLNHEKRAGMFKCVCCGAPLFASDTKFDSGTVEHDRFRKPVSTPDQVRGRLFGIMLERISG